MSEMGGGREKRSEKENTQRIRATGKRELSSCILNGLEVKVHLTEVRKCNLPGGEDGWSHCFVL